MKKASQDKQIEKNPIHLNESCMQWSFGKELNEPTIHATLNAFRTLKSAPPLRDLGVVDLVPTYNKLAIHFNGNESLSVKIEQEVQRLLKLAPPQSLSEGKLHTLSVDYTGEDLPRIAERAGLSIEETIRRHAAPTYLVAMIGFQPHFPYLFGLDQKLETPRLDTPRLQVPAGSVAIGGAQTGVYPSESPGGWNIIGQTDSTKLQAIQPGDQVQFIIQKGTD
jgi:KipI family sensor histidine kinase inhibitor